jgi:hypothetical protein
LTSLGLFSQYLADLKKKEFHTIQNQVTINSTMMGLAKQWSKFREQQD